MVAIFMITLQLLSGAHSYELKWQELFEYQDHQWICKVNVPSRGFDFQLTAYTILGGERNEQISTTKVRHQEHTRGPTQTETVWIPDNHLQYIIEVQVEVRYSDGIVSYSEPQKFDTKRPKWGWAIGFGFGVVCLIILLVFVRFLRKKKKRRRELRQIAVGPSIFQDRGYQTTQPHPVVLDGKTYYIPQVNV